MTRNDTEDLPGASAPVLSAAVLARIHELNLDYIELLAAEHNGGGVLDGQLQHLPCKLHATIASLTPSTRMSLAALPYTLYSLGFEDEKLWRSLAEPATLASSLSMSERYAQPHSHSLQASLCEVALLYAWHVATVEPAGSASHLCDAGGRHAAPDCGAAVVRQTSRCASRFAARCRAGRRTRASGPTWCASPLRETNSGWRQRRCSAAN